MAERFPNDRKNIKLGSGFVPIFGGTFSIIGTAVQDLKRGMRRVGQFQRNLDLVLERNHTFPISLHLTYAILGTIEIFNNQVLLKLVSLIYNNIYMKF